MDRYIVTTSDLKGALPLPLIVIPCRPFHRQPSSVLFCFAAYLISFTVTFVELSKKKKQLRLCT